MSEHAKVTSIAALEEFRAAIAVFSEEIARALMSADADIARALRSLNYELPNHWKTELRRREEAVVKARIDLEQALLSREMGKSSVEERKALAKAKEDVRHARERLEATTRWRRQLERQDLLYRGRIEPLTSFVQAGAPRASNTLRKMIDQLDEYVSLQPAPATDAQHTNPAGAGMPESHPAEPMSRAGTETKPTDLLTLIARRLPSPSQVEATPTGTQDDLPPHPPLSHEERTSLATLPQGLPPDARTFLLIANTARRSQRIAFHRAAAATPQDSGWRVLGLDRKEPSRWTRVPIISLLRARSTAYDLLRLGEGWTAVLAPDQPNPILSLLDANGTDHWSSMSAQSEPTK